MRRLVSAGVALSGGGNLLDSDAFLPQRALPDVVLNGYKPGTNTENTVLALGAGGAWDHTMILHPCAVERSGTIYLFYSGELGTTWKIGVATAPVTGFTGTNFTKYGSNPILSLGGGGSWDADGVLDPWVIFDGNANLWKMWYSGISGGTQRIGYATASSPTGPWTKDASNPVLSPAGWEGSVVMLPAVLRENSVSYKMLYSGNSPTGAGRIGLATSSDGVSWTKYAGNPVLSQSGAGWMANSVFSSRALVFDGTTYYLYFSAKQTGPGYSKSGYADSPDLITWTVGATNPLLWPTHTWEGLETENPNALFWAGNYYVFYDCYFGSPATIGVAVVPV